MSHTNHSSNAAKTGIGTFSALSIGIGGMVGGGIFAVTGLTVDLTRGAAPVAFVIAGIVALLTSYSYLKLTLRYPSQGGTVEFLNRGFGKGILTGSANILLCLSYIVLLAIYAYAFGSYGASLFPKADYVFWKHTLITGVIIFLAIVNFFGAELAIRSENLFNSLKMILLAVFIIAGLIAPVEWSRLSPENYVPPLAIFSGAMIIFLNYEGFELIANAGKDIINPRKALPIAYIGGVIIVIALYILVSMVVVGHMDFSSIQRASDYALSEAAGTFLGRFGFVMLVAAALLATSSAINATFYGSGRLTYLIAKYGELPKELEHDIRNQPLEGMIIFAILTLFIANIIHLNAIATMGSAGFLLIFMAVNVANFKLAKKTGSSALVSLLGAISCFLALAALCWQTWSTTETRSQIWILAAMIVSSVLIEVIYRAITKREIHMGHGRD
jgi:amino acid transporter